MCGGNIDKNNAVDVICRSIRATLADSIRRSLGLATLSVWRSWFEYTFRLSSSIHSAKIPVGFALLRLSTTTSFD